MKITREVLKSAYDRIVADHGSYTPCVVRVSYAAIVHLTRRFGAREMQKSNSTYMTTVAGARFFQWMLVTPAEYVDYMCAQEID
jgi:hypothetical protein